MFDVVLGIWNQLCFDVRFLADLDVLRFQVVVSGINLSSRIMYFFC